MTVDRVPTTAPLTPQQLAAVALLADGWSHAEAARLLGVAVGTLRAHLDQAIMKIPGDLLGRTKVIAWYRGASADVLGIARQLPLRQESLHRAYAISVGTCCPHCGNVLAHDHRPHPASERHE
jgi:DNA-binding CsgD family transcriptional regulator